MEKMVVESGWMKEHLYLVLKKIDEEQKKRGNPGNGLAKKEK